MSEEELFEQQLKLYSSSLLSKGGFWDGDQFADFVNENYYVKRTTQERFMSDEVLKRVVEKYLIPALPVPIKLHSYFPTPHNSIRVCDEDYEELYTQPEVIVSITEQQLRETCEEVKQEYLKEVNN